MAVVRTIELAAREVGAPEARLRAIMARLGITPTVIGGEEAIDEADLDRIRAALAVSSPGGLPRQATRRPVPDAATGDHWTLEELADRAGLSVRTLLRHVRAGRLEAEPAGRGSRVSRRAWEDFLRRGPDDISVALMEAGFHGFAADCLDPFGNGPCEAALNADPQAIIPLLKKHGRAFVYPSARWRRGREAARGLLIRLRSGLPFAEALVLPSKALTATAFGPARDVLLREARLAGAAEVRLAGPPALRRLRCALFLLLSPEKARPDWASAPVVVGRLLNEAGMAAFRDAVQGVYGPRSPRPAGEAGQVLVVDRRAIGGRLDFDYHDPRNDPKAARPEVRWWLRLGDIEEKITNGVVAARRRAGEGEGPPLDARYLTWRDLAPEDPAPGRTAGKSRSPGSVLATGKDLIAPGDVIVNPMLRRAGSVRAVLVTEETASLPAVVSNALVRIRLRPERRGFARQLTDLFNGEVGERHFRKTGRGATFRKVRRDDLLEMPVPDPGA